MYRVYEVFKADGRELWRFESRSKEECESWKRSVGVHHHPERSPSMRGDYWIKDTETDTYYGCYDTFDEASREISKLREDPLSGVTWQTELRIVCE